jgi:hypothetical protein
MVNTRHRATVAIMFTGERFGRFGRSSFPCAAVGYQAVSRCMDHVARKQPIPSIPEMFAGDVSTEGRSKIPRDVCLISDPSLGRVALSRRKQGFESPRERQINQAFR